jgi:serine/threonine protein kinase
MHPADFARVKDIVSRARELAVDARATYLLEVCAGDATLQAEVEALLAYDAKTPSILVTGGFARQFTPEFFDSLPQASAPAAIGSYRILEILGEGGMGTVYRAEQTTPIHREVALKLIRRGLDTDRIVARFEAERQTLALMDHAHIARVLDAGATADGRPYFVMELVAGEPITAFCEAHQLTLAERLALFLAVCQGVQHAHQKGIIHRDLKPSNVLVTEVEGRAVPKIIDFGVAKATGLSLADASRLHIIDRFGDIVRSKFIRPVFKSSLEVEVAGSIGEILCSEIVWIESVEELKVLVAGFIPHKGFQNHG